VAKETPIFALPYPEPTDPPNGAVQIEAAVERVEEILAQIEELLLNAPAAGQIIIVNGTNDPVYKSVTGDIGLSTGGVTSIGEEKVATTMVKNLAITAAKLADQAVTNAKLGLLAVGAENLNNLAVTEAKLAALAVSAGKIAAEAVETGKIKASAVTEAKIAAEAVTTAKIANLAVTEPKLGDGAATSRKMKPTVGEKAMSAEALVLEELYADLAGCQLEITPAVASNLVVTGVFEVVAVEAAVEMYGSVKVDAEAEKGTVARYRGGAASARSTVMQTWVIPLTAALHTIKLRAKRNSAAKGTVFQPGTKMSYQLFAA